MCGISNSAFNSPQLSGSACMHQDLYALFTRESLASHPEAQIFSGNAADCIEFVTSFCRKILNQVTSPELCLDTLQ